jgi:hypothetical protein
VEVATITSEADNNITTNIVITSTITILADNQLLDVSMEMTSTTLVATTEVVVVMEVVLVLYADLPGIRPSNNALRRGKRINAFSLSRSI